MKTKNIFNLAAAACILLAMASLPAGITAVSGAVYTDYWVDGFDGPELSEPWYWINEPGGWDFNPDEETYLFIPHELGNEPPGSSLLLRSLARGDFAIETHLYFEPYENFQFAGLVVYQDESNFFQFGRAFCEIGDPEVCVGNGIYFDKIEGGWFIDGNSATYVDNPSEAYLRLERSAHTLTAFYSENGTDWVEIGAHTIPDGFQVNGVGLVTNKAVYSTSETLAAFDYFSLDQSWGLYPEGNHDGAEGDVSWIDCGASGWAVDPDDRYRDLQVRILSDDVEVAVITADIYRDDLEAKGLCDEGTCGFGLDLWGSITPDEEHMILAQAYDEETGEWVSIDGSPKPLTCQSPNPRFTVFPEWEWFDGLDWPDGAQVNISVEGKPVCTRLSDESSGGFFNGGFPKGCDIVIGDEVTFEYEGTIRTHTVRNLAITSVDTESNIVSGTAEEGETVYVWPHETGQQLEYTAVSPGVWLVDFTGVYDIVPGSDGRSEIRDDAGNATAVDWIAPWFLDKFDGSLAEGWEWFDENPEKWSLDEAPGFLRIYASPYEEGGDNRLLRAINQQDFMIKTRVLFEPYSNFQFAGLYIYQDEENHLALGRAFCDIPEACVGNGIYFDKIEGGWFADDNFATPVDSPSEAYLRLERRGEMVRGFYSADGFTWYEIGIHSIPPDFTVNAVGLIASGDGDKSDEDIAADFDFFKLSEGEGFLPEGYHDYDGGDVPSWGCNAGGWASDPDDRWADLNVEIVVDHQTAANLTAGEPREDLFEVCEESTCAFSTSLWETISSYETHTVAAWAQDNSSGEWVLLNNSPKPLTCRTFDIYTYDPLTGEIVQITNMRDADEYNPSWSPNGKLIAHHVVHSDGSVGFYITDVRTGVSTKVEGVQNSGGAVFSPNGKWIVFHMPGEGGTTNVYIMPAEGGEIELIRENAEYPDWAPNGKRIVFKDLTDKSIRSIPIDGDSSGETLIADYGYNPAWSPDGSWIAYNDDGNVWKVAVNVQGTVFGEPIQLTDSPLGEGHATWSSDSQMIVFHAGMNPDYDLWSIPAEGGEATWLNGAPGVGDYDPAYARNSNLIAYASASPNGQAARPWGVTFSGDIRTWSAGEHSYYMQVDVGLEDGSWQLDPVFFTVDDAPSYEGLVLMRGYALRARVGEECPGFVSSINPAQPTSFHYAWVTDDAITYPEALEFFGSMRVTAYWDGMSEDLIRQEILSWPSIDWDQYLCQSTNFSP